MGSAPSANASSDRTDQPKVVLRLGGNGVSQPMREDLLVGESCFRAPSNGDWYKVICPGSGTVRIMTAKNLFYGSQPPTLGKVLILPISTPVPVEDRSRLILTEFSKVAASYPRTRLHLDIGDVIGTANTSHKFVVVDVDPIGGGILDKDITEVFFDGEPVPICTRCRFSPAFGAASDLDRERFRNFLRRRAGELYLRQYEHVQDDFSKHWIVMETDSSSPSSPCILPSDGAYVSIGWNPEVRPTTECAHCFRSVLSPAPDFDEFAFACPNCNFLVPNPTYSTWVQADRATSGPARQLLNRLRAALSDISARDPRTIVLGSLISRLPKHFDGTLDWRALDEVAVRVLSVPNQSASFNSTPPEVLSRLPISTYTPPAPVAALDSVEQNKGELEEEEDGKGGERCEICLEHYVEGIQIRTLPCFHRFHVSCSDNWLALSKSCPLCKTEVDVDEDRILGLS